MSENTTDAYLRHVRIRQNHSVPAWLSLDGAGNDLPRFPVYLAVAFQKVLKENGTPLLSVFQSPQPPAFET